MPSGIVSNATVTGNVRWGSAETDLSGADVVFGNKSFGNDRTENNLVVGGEIKMNGNTVPAIGYKTVNFGTISSSYTIPNLDFVGQWAIINGNIAKNGSLYLPSSGKYIVTSYRLDSGSYIPNFGILDGGSLIYSGGSYTETVQGLIQKIA
jgi:hypothetical protein